MKDYYTVGEVAKKLGISINTVRRWSEDKEGFPKPCRSSGGHRRWRKVEIREWMDKDTSVYFNQSIKK